MYCPACGDELIVRNRDESNKELFCSTGKVYFPVKVTNIIIFAVKNADLIKAKERTPRVDDSDWRCPNCNNDLHYSQRKKLECNHCNLTIPALLQRYMQNRVGHTKKLDGILPPPLGDIT